MQPKVIILVSTYNGEKYLRSQLDSIIDQDYPNSSILVRDDGSTDTTLEIIKQYSNANQNITFTSGENIGVVASFMTLLQEAPTSDYYAFCDQDDFWYKDKVSRAVTALTESSEPTLYFSALNVVDQSLKNPKPLFLGNDISLANGLVQNVATGCTTVINNKLRQNVLRARDFSKIQMHDWWFYLVALVTGRVIADPKPSMDYRQHPGNVVGMPRNPFKIFRKFKSIYNETSSGIIKKQAKYLTKLYAKEASKEDYDKITLFFSKNTNFFERMSYAFSGKVYRQGFIQNVILKLLIIFNKI